MRFQPPGGWFRFARHIASRASFHAMRKGGACRDCFLLCFSPARCRSLRRPQSPASAQAMRRWVRCQARSCWGRSAPSRAHWSATPRGLTSRIPGVCGHRRIGGRDRPGPPRQRRASTARRCRSRDRMRCPPLARRRSRRRDPPETSASRRRSRSNDATERPVPAHPRRAKDSRERNDQLIPLGTAQP